MKNCWAFLFLTILTVSCNFVPKEVPDSQELLRRELHAIDWSKVDDYPEYASCDTVDDPEKRKACFFDRLNFEVIRVLKNDSLVQLSTIDSVEFLVTLTSKSRFTFKTEKINEKLMPKSMMDSIMEKNQDRFSSVQPATKRGVPVTTQFHLNVKIAASSD